MNFCQSSSNPRMILVDDHNCLPHPPSNTPLLSQSPLELITMLGTPTWTIILITKHIIDLSGHQTTHQKIHHLQKSKPITKQDYHLSNQSYITQKPALDLSWEFDVSNYTDLETKQYSYWYNTNPDEQPPTQLMQDHVAHFNILELNFLDNECEFQLLQAVDFKCYNFLLGMSKT